ncbi:hypothetical protein Dsin_019059 [Dipteronia sinensis]|uniref:Uncharacterized protein n=1 Tax=Dipteronia sinensis TaxID=43782 RepID=A0AAE0A7Y9_9ROSI|nr:hypothetical protein Dsin_019059 [Dipteronia sinensis]
MLTWDTSFGVEFCLPKTSTQQDLRGQNRKDNSTCMHLIRNNRTIPDESETTQVTPDITGPSDDVMAGNQPTAIAGVQRFSPTTEEITQLFCESLQQLIVDTQVIEFLLQLL